MQDLEKVLMQEYEISPKSIKYVKNNYIIAADNARFILKMMNCSKERIQFIFEAKKHLANKGFACIDEDIPSLSREMNAILTTGNMLQKLLFCLQICI